MKKNNFRNFCIIAHIDHGKTTLSDRILELTNTVDNRKNESQILDSMDLEKERGITIKLNAAQIKYKDYLFHLIDTPGHVDFTYEVSRSLAACEGALLVVDASQGIQAQTISNVYLALGNNLEIIPIINKVDLPAADPERVMQNIESLFGISCENAPLISAKTGLNIDKVIAAIIEKVPPPEGDDNNPLQALIFDSFYDEFKGVIVIVRIKEGTVKVGQEIKFMSNNKVYKVTEVGIKTPKFINTGVLVSGEVGWIAGSIRNIKDINIGDTITTVENPAKEPLPGYKTKKPIVFCGLFPIESKDYQRLRDAIDKLKLSDSSFVSEPETSKALGFGFRCGFLGLLHMEIIQERLEREYNLELIATSPSVTYKVHKTDGEIITIDNPSFLPSRQNYDIIEEPFVKIEIMVPDEYVGKVMDLAHSKRAVYRDMQVIDQKMRQLVYDMPLAEIIFGFFDSLKSLTKGYASLEYDMIGYKESDLVKMDILLNAEIVDALSTICHRSNAYYRGKAICEKLKEVIPRHQFEVPIQAALGGKIIARETIKAYRKDVLAKCYGGDVSRKRKLLEKQKEGKKRMKQVGSVAINQEAFLSVLNIKNEN